MPALLEHVAPDAAYVKPITRPTDRNGMAAVHGDLFSTFSDFSADPARGADTRPRCGWWTALMGEASIRPILSRIVCLSHRDP